MSYVLSMLEFFWSPGKVVTKKLSWLVAYAATALSLILIGMFTQAKIMPAISDSLTTFGYGPDAVSLVGRGALYGVFISALLLPLILPWVYALVSKFVALFTGSGTTFAEFYYLYQWANFGSTVLVVAVKLALFSLVPVSNWGSITLSTGAFIPMSAGKVREIASVLDLSLVLLFAFSWTGLRAAGKARDVAAPAFTVMLLAACQIAVIL